MKLKIENLSKSYGTTSVLENVSYTFSSGKIYGLIGRNGAGKTTFFNCLNGSVSKNSGEITLMKGDGFCALRQEDIGFVESTPILPEFLTGAEFIGFLKKIQNCNESLDDLFALVDLKAEDQNKLIKAYSHGMKNKIQMLSIFICKAPVLFLDEPLTSLDVVVASEIKKVILSLKQDHIIIFSTHILQLAQDLCDELVILQNGTFTQVDNSRLHDANFEQQIVALLEEDV